MTLRRTALVADASAEIRRAQAETLRDLGFLVLEAEDGFQVLDRLRKVKPALIVLDLSLQGLDGTEVLHFLRRNEEWADIPVIVCSAVMDGWTRRTVSQCGGTVLLPKPCPPELLHREAARIFRAPQPPPPPDASEPALALLLTNRTSTRDSLQELLEEESFEVVVATSGDEALARIALLGQPELVVVDWDSSPEEALRLVEVLRRCRVGRPPHVLMVCNPLDVRAMAAAARAGVDQSLGEPITRLILVERLKKLGLL